MHDWKCRINHLETCKMLVMQRLAFNNSVIQVINRSDVYLSDGQYQTGHCSIRFKNKTSLLTTPITLLIYIMLLSVGLPRGYIHGYGTRTFTRAVSRVLSVRWQHQPSQRRFLPAGFSTLGAFQSSSQQWQYIATSIVQCSQNGSSHKGADNSPYSHKHDCWSTNWPFISTGRVPYRSSVSVPYAIQIQHGTWLPCFHASYSQVCFRGDQAGIPDGDVQ